MINLTSQYPNQIFLPQASSQLISQVNAINSSGINNRQFPKKFGRVVTAGSPDGLGASTIQIDTLINPVTMYAFQNLNDARTYALQAANEVANNPCYYVENNQVVQGYYQVIVWGVA